MSSTSASSSTEAAEVQQVVPNANDGTSTATVATPTAAVPDLPEVCDDDNGARPPLPANMISEEEEKKMKGKKNMSTPSTPAPPGRPPAALPAVLPEVLTDDRPTIPPEYVVDMADAEVEKMSKKLPAAGASADATIPNRPEVLASGVGFMPPDLVAELVLVEGKKLAAANTADQESMSTPSTPVHQGRPPAALPEVLTDDRPTIPPEYVVDMADAEVEKMGKKLLSAGASTVASIPNHPEVFASGVGFILPDLDGATAVEEMSAAAITADPDVLEDNDEESIRTPSTDVPPGRPRQNTSEVLSNLDRRIREHEVSHQATAAARAAAVAFTDERDAPTPGLGGANFYAVEATLVPENEGDEEDSVEAPPLYFAEPLPSLFASMWARHRGKIIAGLIGVLLLVIALITIVFVVLNPADPPLASTELTSSPRPSFSPTSSPRPSFSPTSSQRPSFSPTLSQRPSFGPTSSPRPSFGPTSNPSSNPTSNPSVVPATERLKVIVAGLYDPSSSNFEFTPSKVLDDPASSQSLALEWLTTKDSAYIDMTYPDAGEENDALLLQRYALTQLYYATSGANWTNSAGFLTPNGYECDEWRGNGKGVDRCDIDGRVTELYFDWNNLRGTLPEELSLLTQIQLFHFSSNDLYGPLPRVYSGLTNMIAFVVWGNELTGTIPNEYGSGWSDSLEEFVVDSNNLTGTILSGSGWSDSLEVFSVSNNVLTGTIPSTIASSSKLSQVYFSDNEFVGTMPTEFCDLPDLIYLVSDCVSEVTCSCCTYCS